MLTSWIALQDLGGNQSQSGLSALVASGLSAVFQNKKFFTLGISGGASQVGICIEVNWETPPRQIIPFHVAKAELKLVIFFCPWGVTSDSRLAHGTLAVRSETLVLDPAASLPLPVVRWLSLRYAVMFSSPLLSGENQLCLPQVFYLKDCYTITKKPHFFLFD